MIVLGVVAVVAAGIYLSVGPGLLGLDGTHIIARLWMGLSLLIIAAVVPIPAAYVPYYFLKK